MQNGWLNRTLGGRVIQHVPCPNPGSPVNVGAPPAGVLHTIEGSLSSGMSVFHQHFAPHFALDAHETLQLVPLGTMAAALENHVGGVETNSITRVQIEVAGDSQTSPWLWDDATTNAVADLIATVSKAAGIPLDRPFPDQMPALPWATEAFSRRHAGKWGHVAGWYGHVEVPENSHWDPGRFAGARSSTRRGDLRRRPGRRARRGQPRRPTDAAARLVLAVGAVAPRRGPLQGPRPGQPRAPAG